MQTELMTVLLYIGRNNTYSKFKC